MRPQRNAGEYSRRGRERLRRSLRFNEAPAKCRGIRLHVRFPARAAGLASMRPQRNAGEYPIPTFGIRGGTSASMRPQRNAGEYGGPAEGRPEGTGRFNEAPAKCRGIPGARYGDRENEIASMRPQRNAGEYAACIDVSVAEQPASMRPQRNAGEYRNRAGSCTEDARGFNEAPAKCRGIRRLCLDGMIQSDSCFNEAPAKCRGIRRNFQGTNRGQNGLQ